ncbi:MAG TPA: tetratricopeptide repeat protein, partial [Methanothrix sp.]|nr:tetratricopeptide repeat protein [Methanothrix sp.]
LRIDEKVYGPDHPQVAIRINNLGSVMQAMGDFEGAKVHFERALNIFQDRLGEEHPKTRLVRTNLESLKRQR